MKAFFGQTYSLPSRNAANSPVQPPRPLCIFCCGSLYCPSLFYDRRRVNRFWDDVRFVYDARNPLWLISRFVNMRRRLRDLELINWGSRLVSDI
ncbi:hypothetical protein CEXT_731071 [Caerostris extrusa]|uniref:Uncharacterized protein n=1 Tax=Caerostris extrusa TaxID=172846 RepID=A0AAV4VW44_CAEEX|nr:hypothetical protein CEXT_731071 [Caerostris extrusa]